MESIINNTTDTLNFHLTCYPKADETVLPKLQTLRPDTVVTVSPNFSAEDYLLCDGNYIMIGVWKEGDVDVPNSWVFIESTLNKIELYKFDMYKIEISGNIKENAVITINNNTTSVNLKLDWIIYGIILFVVAAILTVLILKYRKK